VLGHLQRGGSPTAFDRMLASSFGSAAVEAIAQGKFGHLIAWKSNGIIAVPLEQAARRAKVVQRDHYLINVARGLGITFAGDED
jgi:6-phosphofructokinase